jgi:hypothetical protein
VIHLVVVVLSLGGRLLRRHDPKERRTSRQKPTRNVFVQQGC